MTTYQAPTPTEIRQLLSAWNLTGGQAAALVAKESGRTVRRWTSGQSKVGFGDLFALAFKVRGLAISIDTWRADLAADLQELDK